MAKIANNASLNTLGSVPMLTAEQCQLARLARDARFDGVFYTGVLSTGIYCRPICPARSPKEDNVRYLPSAAACAEAGFRPCLRCKPDAAPGAKQNALVAATLMQLSDGDSVAQIARSRGMSERHLRQQFVEALGVAPKQYQLYQRCLLAKQLLHQTAWPVTQIAFASGFDSVRRFNDCFATLLQLTPTQVRAQHRTDISTSTQSTLTINLSYRPPYNWPWVQAFLSARAIEGLEFVDQNSYGRSFYCGDEKVFFVARHQPKDFAFKVELSLSDWRVLPAAVGRIRKILDLDANSFSIDQALQKAAPHMQVNEGLRLPQFPSLFEAGIRAVLGQQVSVAAARKLVTQVVDELGESDGEQRWFPKPATVASHSLEFLKMPGARRETLRRLAEFCANNSAAAASEWLALKGIGPWTVDYARMRGEADTNIWLSGDLGVKHGVEKVGEVSPDLAQPWCSYLTIQMWSQLA